MASAAQTARSIGIVGAKGRIASAAASSKRPVRANAVAPNDFTSRPIQPPCNYADDSDEGTMRTGRQPTRTESGPNNGMKMICIPE